MLPTNFTFYICGRHELQYHIDKKINYFIGFNHPGCMEPYTEKDVQDMFSSIGDYNGLKSLEIFEVHDAYTKDHSLSGLKMPDKVLINQILCHAVIVKKMIEEHRDVNILFCCAAGISRSTAACYILLCYLMGEWNERLALALVKNKRYIARPNPLMVQIADKLLKRHHKMVAPLGNYLQLAPEDDLLLF